MNADVIKVLGGIAGIGGLAVGLMMILFRDIIASKIFPKFDRNQGYSIVKDISNKAFVIALLGIASYTLGQYLDFKKHGEVEVPLISKRRIIGKVTDDEGPINGAKIDVIGHFGITDNTDVGGNFAVFITGTKPETIDLNISIKGYDDFPIKVDVNYLDDADINLRELKLTKKPTPSKPKIVNGTMVIVREKNVEANQSEWQASGYIVSPNSSIELAATGTWNTVRVATPQGNGVRSGDSFVLKNSSEGALLVKFKLESTDIYTFATSKVVNNEYILTFDGKDGEIYFIANDDRNPNKKYHNGFEDNSGFLKVRIRETKQK